MVLCRQNGIELKNQLSTVGPELREQIVELVKRGPSRAAGAPRPGDPPPAPRPLPPGGNRPSIRPAMAGPAPLRPLPPPRPLEHKKPVEKVAKPMVAFTKEQLDKIGKQPLRPEDV